MVSASAPAAMSPQIIAAIVLGVTIPVTILVLLLAYIWTLRRRLQKQSLCDEEAFGDFKVNCVHKLVKIEDIQAKAPPPTPSLAETTAHTPNSPAVEADSNLARAPEQIEYTRPASASLPIDPPRYSDKQVAPDPVLPEVISGPHHIVREALVTFKSTEKAEPCNEKKLDAKKERLTVDEIIGIDNRTLFQDLPAYQGRPPCLHVATANLGQPNTFVSPWDVEFKPNPFIFSHLTSPGGTLDPITPVSAISANSPTSPVPNELQGPFEMDAVESEFNPWLHPPRTLIHGVPHRWEKTIGVDRMFFEAEHDLFPNRKRRSSVDYDASVNSPRRRCRGRTPSSQSHEYSPSSSRSPSNDTPTNCLHGPSSHKEHYPLSCATDDQLYISHDEEGTATEELFEEYRVSPSNISLDETVPEQEWTPGDDQQWQPTSGKEPEMRSMAWADIDLSFATQLAASHEQQLRFFDKFRNSPESPVSPFRTSRRGLFDFGGDSPVTSTPRSSLKSFGSLLTPVTPVTPQSSSSSSIFPSRSTTSLSSATTVSVDTSRFPCSDCDQKFRTPGMRNNHYNRKHNLRYTCVLCSTAFGLRKDLQRHESTVHKVLFPSNVRLFCPNPGCATPQKEFNRKDNFNRHVERCREAVETRGTAR